MEFSINDNGNLRIYNKPIIMGILNFTPDSFYDGGKHFSVKNALQQIEKMAAEGAEIIDIGAQSTRPNAISLSANEELERIQPLITEVKSKFPQVIFSIDTFYSSVANNALEKGFSIVNDISSGEADSLMLQTVAKYNATYVMMHRKGDSQTMQQNPQYTHVTQEIIEYLEIRKQAALAAGIKDIIIDPGFGFGKNIEHNYQLLSELNAFKILGCPILVGMSRKSMLYKPLNTTADNVLAASVAAHTIALLKGANILRVHDVKETKQMIEVLGFLSK